MLKKTHPVINYASGCMALQKKSEDTEVPQVEHASNVSLTPRKLILGCISQNAASRLREVILPLCSALVGTTCIQIWACKLREMQLPHRVQQKATKTIQAVEFLSYEVRQGDLGLSNTYRSLKGMSEEGRSGQALSVVSSDRKKPNQHELKHSMFPLNIRKCMFLEGDKVQEQVAQRFCEIQICCIFSHSEIQSNC